MNPLGPTRTSRQHVRCLMVLAAISLLVACRAPGMKLNASASDRPTQVEMAGVQVTLRALNAEAIKDQPLATPSPEDLKQLLAPKATPYLIGPQDVLIVTVWDHPELSLPLGQFRSDAATGTVVDDDGSFYYPYVGRLPVAGLTVPPARTKLAAALEKSLRNPQVDIKVLLYRSQKVFVGGEVRSPAVYPITDVPFTLAEAANRAGGFTPTADLSRMVLSRGERRWTLNFLHLLTQGNRIGQILLKDGDSVHVPHRDEAPVYLLGEVRNPKSVPLYNGRISLAQAISDAGGLLTSSANARSIYVLRAAAQGRVDVYHLDAYNPVAMVMADRFALQPRDIVYVDPGPLVRWNRVVGLLMPTVTALTSTATDAKFLSQ